MEYIYARNITEIRNDYTMFLTSIITPFLYEGIKSVYSFALNAHKEFLERGKHDPTIKSPGVLKLFQTSLKEMPGLNNNDIEIETQRIKSGSKCADYFDDLVRAVIKSNIILLTFSNSRKYPDIVKEKYENKVEVKDFIHKCYIESARAFYNNPELFWHEFPPLEMKRNQREACDLIKLAIGEAIRKMLPIKLILKEYLSDDYIEDDNDISRRIPESQYMNIQSMITRDLYGDDLLGRKPVPQGGILEDDDLGPTHNAENTTGKKLIESSSEETSSESDNAMDDDEALREIEKHLRESEKPEEVHAPAFHQDEPQIAEQNTINQPADNPHVIPQAALNNEIQELLKKSNSVLNDEKNKKPSKRDIQLLKEIEDQIRPKKEEPDRKQFFEQYMK